MKKKNIIQSVSVEKTKKGYLVVINGKEYCEYMPTLILVNEGVTKILERGILPEYPELLNHVLENIKEYYKYPFVLSKKLKELANKF